MKKTKKIVKRQKETLIHLVAIIAGLYIIYYLTWRFLFTLNADAMAFSLLLWGAELLGALNFFLFTFITWKIVKHPPKTPLVDKTVDIFVPTYNEDLQILEATLTGCNLVEYPHTTYILDDGHREEVKRLAEEFGCNYISRPDNTHAKAGNINYALKHTQGEYIVLLDADMIPQPDFIHKTLGYFEDQNVALVQLPQEFYNTNSFQHNDTTRDIWHDQTLFFRLIQPGKDSLNSAFWCGSPSILRRDALDSIGGIATGTITEDIHTSIRLHANKWKTIYYDEVLAFGIAPQSLHSFTVQRLRWAQGSMQLLKSGENPLWMKGLNLSQRLSYFTSMTTYFEGYQKLIYFSIPLYILLTGILPIDIEFLSFLGRWAIYFLLGQLANRALGRGTYNYLQIEKFNILKMFVFIKASFTLIWPSKLTFKVTPKSTDNNASLDDKKNLKTHYSILILTFVAFLIGIINLFIPLTAQYDNILAIYVALFWSISNAGLIFYSIRHTFKMRYHRQSFRFPLKTAFSIECKDRILLSNEPGVFKGVTYDLSSAGIGITLTNKMETDFPINITLYLDNELLKLKGKVIYQKKRKDNLYQTGIQLEPLKHKEKTKLLAYAFVYTPRRLLNKQPGVNISSESILKWLSGVSEQDKNTILKRQRM